MAKEQRDKYDLFTLATKVIEDPQNPGVYKNPLKGAEIVFEDDTSAEVKDWHIDYATNEIHIDFTDGTDDSFSLKRKYVVKIDTT